MSTALERAWKATAPSPTLHHPPRTHAPHHPRDHHHHHQQHAAAADAVAASTEPSPPATVLISAPIAASVPPWYAREAVGNWLRFTVASTRVVLHMDRSRPVQFSSADPGDVDWRRTDWRWLRDDAAARERVLVNPRRLYTSRRRGSIFAAHVHN